MSLLQNPDKQSLPYIQGSPTPAAKQQGYIVMISISVFTLALIFGSQYENVHGI